jgi:hypothetical protein
MPTTSCRGPNSTSIPACPSRCRERSCCSNVPSNSILPMRWRTATRRCATIVSSSAPACRRSTARLRSIFAEPYNVAAPRRSGYRRQNERHSSQCLVLRSSLMEIESTPSTRLMMRKSIFPVFVFEVFLARLHRTSASRTSPPHPTGCHRLDMSRHRLKLSCPGSNAPIGGSRLSTSEEAALLAFFDFPAEHWDHLRTSNPIESVFD